MDGTLVNSEPLWGIATFEMSERLGRRLTPELREQTVGGTFANTISICEKWAGVELSAEQKAEQYRLMVARMQELFAAQLVLNPGVEPLLTELHAAGIPMMITTNTPREIAGGAIQAIGSHFFVDTLCGDDVTKGKPDPEIYATAAARLQLDPQQCLVFEDSGTGMAAAAAAGCRLIGLPVDDTVPVPAGAGVLSQLSASGDFQGVNAATVFAWFEKLGQ